MVCNFADGEQGLETQIVLLGPGGSDRWSEVGRVYSERCYNFIEL